jgi:hypothetical protein
MWCIAWILHGHHRRARPLTNFIKDMKRQWGSYYVIVAVHPRSASHHGRVFAQCSRSICAESAHFPNIFLAHPLSPACVFYILLAILD